MSTAPAAALRGSAKAASSRQGWWASLKGEAVSFLKGDNNAPWAILAETVIGCVPILGQVVDARDIIKGLIEVSGAPSNPVAWFNLITALIGVVPGGGDAAKRSLRAVKAGTANVDDLLAMIRRFYKGDPEKLLREVLDVSVLRKKLDEILTNPKLLNQLPSDMRRQINEIRQGLGKQFDNFKKEVDGWLAKGRKTSADTGPAAKRGAGAPSQKPRTTVREGTKNQRDGSHSNSAEPRQPNASTQRTARFKQLSQKVLGVLGEHMADYHCQNTKGWGTKVVHDSAGVNNHKLNDRGRMVQLWPVIPRGRGIDAVWKKSNVKGASADIADIAAMTLPGQNDVFGTRQLKASSKPYAIIEAKASYNPAKSLRALLGEAGDKNGSSAGSGGNDVGRGSGAGGRGKQGKSTVQRQTNGKVTQMSHGWIERRMRSIKLTDADALIELRTQKDKAYSRHVLLFSIPHAVSHAEALILHAAVAAGTAKGPVHAQMHSTHEVTREWRDSDIAKVVDSRSGLTDTARNRK